MVDGWRSPQKPEGPSGRRCEDWTRRKELLFPDAGIVVRDRRIPPDTRLAGSSPCLIPGVHRDHNLALDSPALIRGFRTPAPYEAVVRLLGPAFESLPRRKPRGGWGLVRRARPMEILGWRTKRSRDFGRWRRGEFAAKVKATSLFAEDFVSGGRRRGGWRGTGDRVRTSASCSGAWLEAERSGFARRKAGRRRS
jgi:hypothetical protein